MADLTYQILTDRDAFPDDAEITLKGGQTVTVKQFRDAMIPKADMTKMSTEWSRKEKQLTDALQGNQAQITAYVQQLEDFKRQAADEIARARAEGQAPKGQDAWALIEQDPTFGPTIGALRKEIDGLKADREDLRKSLDAHAQTLQQHRDTWVRAGFVAQLNDLKRRPDAKDVDWNQFLDFTKSHAVVDPTTQMVDLASTYNVFTFDKQLENARAAGEQAGIEKGKTMAAVPRIPIGRTAVRQRPAGVPERIQDVTDDMIANDPDIQAAVEQDYAAGAA